MLIRSQDKRKIVNIDNVDSVAAEYGEIKAYNGNTETRIIIGDYSKREKAIKVLDMICEHYQYLQKCKYGLIGIQEINFVFQMPQESEVQDE